LREGVDLGEFARRYQVDPEEKYRYAIQRHLMDGTMVMEQGRLKFTEKGIDLSSYILVDFI
jgi:oxygen-independent coproporphyrinogen-3 oxidase